MAEDALITPSNPNIIERVKRNIISLVNDYYELYRLPLLSSPISMKFNGACSRYENTVLNLLDELHREGRLHKLISRDADIYMFPIREWTALDADERAHVYAMLPPRRKSGRRLGDKNRPKMSPRL